MNVETQINNQRVAKNTLLLYVRTIFVMLVSLYTSRVVLKALGVNDYGIYNVVGGFVAMFSIISNALTSTLMRFITFELGHGDKDKLNRIFSTGVNIQILLSFIIILLIETFGVWFLNNKMNIPLERVSAANWVLQCSAITFAIGLLNVPYNAVIVAHERMSVYAYISIIEASLKLGVVYLLFVSKWDKLVLYAILQTIVVFIVRLIYGLYCNRHFEETKYHRVHDKELVKEMFGFAGWSFFPHAAYVLNTQGVNIAINMFFNVGVNAARGIASQVQHAVMQFIDNFTTALNPQITKSYAAGEIRQMELLVIRGAKLSYFLALIICLPILVETEYILQLWLTEVPSHTIAFTRLAIIGTLIDKLGNTGYTACMATGRIKQYVIWLSSVGCLVFPVTIVAYCFGAPVESTYIIYAIVYFCVDIVRLWIMKGLLSFPVWEFVKEVLFKILIVTPVAVIGPIIFIHFFPQSFVRLFFSVIISVFSAAISSYLIGLSYEERKAINAKIANYFRHNKR